MRYRLSGTHEKITFGEYPAIGLQDARLMAEEARSQVARGKSPMRAKQDHSAHLKNPDTVDAFAERWYTEVVEKNNIEPRNIRRVLDKDVIPAIGRKRLNEVTPADVLAITDRIKKRGADQMALQTRNVLKRLFSYGMARQLVTTNPAAIIEAKYIAVARSRDVALSPEEVGRLLRGIYTSNMRRAHKLALHLLVLCMVRKSELIEALWAEIDFEKAVWVIPAERMKKDREFNSEVQRV